MAQAQQLCGVDGANCPVGVGIPADDPTFLGPPLVSAVDGCGLVVQIQSIALAARKVAIYAADGRELAQVSVVQPALEGVTLQLPGESYASVGTKITVVLLGGDGVESDPVVYDLAAPVPYETAPFVDAPVYECAYYSFAGSAMPGAATEFAYDPYGTPEGNLNWNMTSSAGITGGFHSVLPTPTFDPARVRTSLGRGTTARWMCVEEELGPFASESRKVIEYPYTIPTPFPANTWEDVSGATIASTFVEGQQIVRIAGIEEGAEARLEDVSGRLNVNEAVWPRGAQKEVDLRLLQPITLGGEYQALQRLCEASPSTKVYGTIACEDAPPPIAYPYNVGDTRIHLRQWVPGYQVRVFHAGVEVAKGLPSLSNPYLPLADGVVIAYDDELTIVQDWETILE